LAPVFEPPGFGFAAASGATPLDYRRATGHPDHWNRNERTPKKSPQGPSETLTPSPQTTSVIGEAKDDMKIVPLVERIGTTEG